jgi:acyl dehydratase
MVLKASRIKTGDTYTEQIVKDLKRTQIVRYAGASGDYNPVHTDEIFAVKVAGFPSVFAHGMLTMGMTAKELTNYVGDSRLTYYGVRFTSQVWPGDDLEAQATVVAIREEKGRFYVDLKVETFNQKGVLVLNGNASALIDP